MAKKKKILDLKIDFSSTFDTSRSILPCSPLRILTKSPGFDENEKIWSESPNEQMAITDNIFNDESKNFLRKYLNKKQRPNLESDNLAFAQTQNFGKTQINSPVMKNMTPTQRSKVIQMACEDPGVIYTFMNRKLFIKDQESTSPIIIKKNKLEKSHENIGMFNKTQEIGRPISSFEKERTMKKTNIFHPKKSSTPKTTQKSLFLCETIDNIIKSCKNVEKSSKSVKLSSKIKRENQIAKCYTQKMGWVSNKLKSLDNYKGEIMEKLYENIRAENKNFEDEAQIAFKDMQNSSSDVRRQSYQIKGVLRRNKNKIL